MARGRRRRRHAAHVRPAGRPGRGEDPRRPAALRVRRARPVRRLEPGLGSTPFGFSLYMTGGEPFNGTGDPDFVSVVPPAQYLPRYTFFTDPTYPRRVLVVVRARDAGRVAPLPDAHARSGAGLVAAGAAGSSRASSSSCAADLHGGTRVGGRTPRHVADRGRPRRCAFVLHRLGLGQRQDPGPTSQPATSDQANPLFTRWQLRRPGGANFLGADADTVSRAQ